MWLLKCQKRLPFDCKRPDKHSPFGFLDNLIPSYLSLKILPLLHRFPRFSTQIYWFSKWIENRMDAFCPNVCLHIGMQVLSLPSTHLFKRQWNILWTIQSSFEERKFSTRYFHENFIPFSSCPSTQKDERETSFGPTFGRVWGKIHKTYCCMTIRDHSVFSNAFWC